MKLLAIDPSLNCTGLAFPDQTTTTLRPPKGLDGAARLVWIRNRILDLLRTKDQFDAVVLEDYSYASANSAHQIGELGGILRVLFYENEIPVALVSPGQLKQWATGKGNSKKEVVLSDLTHRAGRTFATSDEAEAWALGAMGAARIGRPWVTMPKDRVAVLGKVRWPDCMGAGL